MRRSQARQVELPEGVPLADIPCRRCSFPGVTVIALGSNANGAIELAWCGPGCASLDGWPWLKGERGAEARA